MVASASPHATRAGVEILEAGGNAFDAACAVAFALSVCEPHMSGLGGQTLGIVHTRGRTVALDGSSRVPSLANREAVAGQHRRDGYRAATVPSTPATLAWLNRQYGRMSWAAVIEPAVRIAHDGYPITPHEHQLQERELQAFFDIPSRSGARRFLADGRAPYPVGQIFRQGELAGTLEQLAREGVESFYQGPIAQRIDADMRANGGMLRADDLALIPWPIERRPLRRRYRGVAVATMPPPGAGRTLLLVLMMLNHLDPAFLAGTSTEKYHFLAETFRKAFRHRTERPFDPDTYPQIRDKRMLNRDFAREQAESIAETVDPTLPFGPSESALQEVGETTHVSVMDGDGNVAAITQSIELAYGSKAAADGLGFLYNNYLMALETEDPSHPYYLRPGAVPWSSAAPAIVFLKGQPWIAMGSPGSERIYSSLAQFLSHVVDGSTPIDEAVRRPRLHCSMKGAVSLEAERFPAGVVPYLEGQGYKVERLEPFSFSLGCVQVVLRRHTAAGFQGVADPRRGGGAAGPA
jgi:gamma-glutamyltranspeptidase/glutathione hydrolase